MAQQIHKYPDFAKQLNRLNSFKNFVCAKIKPAVLSDVGYFYTEQNNELVCYSCGYSLGEWIVLYNLPYLQHTMESPDCSIVRTDSVHKKKSGHDIIKLFNSEEYDLQKNYKKRINTFKKWPLSYIRKEDLARDGFFYLNIQDKVQCEYCFVQIFGFKKGDNPYDEHKKRSKMCYKVVLNNEQETLNKLKLELPSRYDDKKSRILTYKTWPFKVNPESFIEFGFSWCFETDSIKCFSCDLKIPGLSEYLKEMNDLCGPQILQVLGEALHFMAFGFLPRCRFLVDKQYSCKLYKKLDNLYGIATIFDFSSEKWTLERMKDPAIRHLTYGSWFHTQITAWEMVHAGFYYLGFGDCVQCPFCNVQLDKFVKGEKPLEKHEKESPNCPFLQNISSGSQVDMPKGDQEEPVENEKRVKIGFKFNPLKLDFGGNFEYFNKNSRNKKKNNE